MAQGNGSREATKIKRIEIEAVLTGVQKVKACVVDQLGTVSREEAERFGPTWNYFRGLVKVLQALPLDDKKPLQNIQTRIMKISEAPALRISQGVYERIWRGFGWPAQAGWTAR